MHIRYNTSNKITTANDFGDVQLDFDVQIDSILFEALKDCGVVYGASSEERPYLTKLNENGKFFVTFDPLDGSSIIDSNLAIGTIAGIWLKSMMEEPSSGSKVTKNFPPSSTPTLPLELSQVSG